MPWLIMMSSRSYPHVRGAYLVGSCRRHISAELSPRTWGVPFRLAPVCLGIGAIPTCVGLTCAFATPATALAELSPRAWGLHRPLRPGRPGCGATPTDVGRTYWRGLLHDSSGVIPTCVGRTS